MKKLTIILLAFFSISGLNAQYIYNDFDGNQNEEFGGFNNNPFIVANPDPSGINTSANVAEWERGEGFQWAHVYTELDGKIDFTTGTAFQLKVYSPIACEVLFKLEDKTNAGVFLEVMGNVTTVNQWQLLTYDFSGAASGTYDKLVIFFDFATTVNNTFYFDDVEGPEYGGGSTGDPVTLPVTFDDENVNYALTDFGGNVSEIIVDPTNAANMVAKSIKTETAETWAGTTVGGTVGFPVPIPFAEGETVMTVAVWSPDAGTPIRLKVEAASDPTISVETETNTSLAQAWEVMTFDFSNEAPGTEPINFANSYNKASIFFNFGTTGAIAGEKTYYWDDMEFGGSAGPSLIFFPANGATDVETTVNPSLSFSVPVEKIDGSEITNADIAGIVTFKETDASGVDVPFAGTINTSKTLITIDPTSDLANGQVYYLALNGFVIKYVDGDFIPGQDVTFTTGADQKPYLALDVQDNFENDGWSTIDAWFFQDPDMLDLAIVEDPVNSANHVADYARTGNFDYANAQCILNHRMDLTERNSFDLKVYFPSSNDYTGALTPTAAIKLQNSLLGPDAWTTQTEVKLDVTDFDQWVTLTFDFAVVSDRDDYDQIVVQLGGEAHAVPGQFYFDDFQLMGESINGNLSFSPADGTTGVDVTVSPTLSFSLPVAMTDGSEITNGDIASIVAFKETDATGADVPYTGTINAEKTIITIDPTMDLEEGQAYYVALNNEVIKYQGGDPISGQSATFTTAVGVKPYLALDVQDNFENDGWTTIDEWFFQDPDMLPLNITIDPDNAANHVADYNRTGSFEYTNAQFILDHRMDLNEMNIFELLVYFPSSNDYSGALATTAAIKLQNSLLGGNAWTTQTEILQDVDEFDQWVTLHFDFSAIADSVNYDQVVVQLGGEGHLVPAQFYFDDIQLMSDVGIGEPNFTKVQVFPNPAIDVVNINGVENITSVQVFNNMGQLVMLQENSSQRLNISELSSGIYNLTILDEKGQRYYSKVLKR